MAILGGISIAALLLCRRSLPLRRTLLVAIAGFTGMVLEGALILAYQISEGVLYQDLGLLLAMFMSGLALGSWAIDRTADTSRGADALPAQTGAALLVGTAALSCLTAWNFVSSHRNSLSSTALLLLTAGLLTGALFAYASLLRVESQGAVVAPLYAADLFGGFVGSIVGSLFLLPVLGLPASVLLTGLLALAALALI
jgi:spermidine synthase